MSEIALLVIIEVNHLAYVWQPTFMIVGPVLMNCFDDVLMKYVHWWDCFWDLHTWWHRQRSAPPTVSCCLPVRNTLHTHNIGNWLSRNSRVYHVYHSLKENFCFLIIFFWFFDFLTFCNFSRKNENQNNQNIRKSKPASKRNLLLLCIPRVISILILFTCQKEDLQK